MDELEDKDLVRVCRGFHMNFRWSIHVYLNASGMYYAFAKVGKRQFLTEDCTTEKIAAEVAEKEVERFYAEVENAA